MPAPKKSILIVDDEINIVNLLVAVLENKYKCMAVTNGRQAISLLKSHSFNLILTDVKLPDMLGFELCRLGKSMSPNTIVLLMSGVSDINLAYAAKQYGAYDYIQKPFDFQDVVAMVDSALVPNEE